MRISTKLRIGYILSALSVIFTDTMIYVSFQQMHITSKKLRLADTITRSVFEIYIASNEYLLYHEERQRIQWEIMNKELSRLLKDETFHNPKDQSLLKKICEDLRHARILFSDLVSMHLKPRDIFEVELSRQMQNRLKSLLLLKSQSLFSYSTQLKNRIENELFSIQEHTNWMSMALLMALALFPIIIGFLISKSIIVPIKTLVSGTEIIGSGNLEFRLATDRSDEIGELSKSFDQMIIQLKDVMVSHDELENRIKERTAELTESNRLLAFEIDKRTHAQEALKASELRYQIVADYAYDWESWEDSSGTLRYTSPSCERITGYRIEEFKRDSGLMTKIVLPEDKEIWMQHKMEVHEMKTDKGQGMRQVSFRIRKKDGEIRWIEHVCRPIIDTRGHFQGFRASNRDITERKQIEDALQFSEANMKRAQEELTHATRIATAGELTVALAHELNQPLSAIMNNAQAAQRFLTQQKPDLAEVREILSDIVNDDRRAAEVIRKLRTMLKKTAVERGKLDINDIIQEVIPIIHSHMIIKNVSLILDLDENIPFVYGDRTHLHQVILNLVINGIDAMRDVISKRLCVRTAQEGPEGIVVNITDSGTGIRENDPEEIFNPFFTTKEDGMGMGLSICRSIIQAHGGKIWAANNPDQGARFSFTLPAYKGAQRDKPHTLKETQRWKGTARPKQNWPECPILLYADLKQRRVDG